MGGDGVGGDREFLLTLALAMGRPNPDAMLAEMMPFHLIEWRAFYDRQPWGDMRADFRNCLLAMAFAKAIGNPDAVDFDSMNIFPMKAKSDDEDYEEDEEDERNVITGAELAARYAAKQAAMQQAARK